MLAHIATAKYVDGLPLHRQERQFERLGITMSRATLARWMIQLGAKHVVPLINLLNEHLQAASLVHCDETPLQVLKSAKPASSDHWMWVRACGPPGRRIILFDYDASRAGIVPIRLLADFTGTLLTDGYEGYNAVVQARGLTHAGCWAHARRYFKAAQKTAVSDKGHAQEALRLIGYLYAVEKRVRSRKAPLTPSEVLQLRKAHSQPVVDELKCWLDTLAPKVLPKSALGKAVHYTRKQWQKLTRFLEDGEIPLDNNRVENALRPFVIGRKNFLFCDTQAGATASANLYSLVETAKANGMEPHAYLTRVFTELPKVATVDDYEALLPWNLKAQPNA